MAKIEDNNYFHYLKSYIKTAIDFTLNSWEETKEKGELTAEDEKKYEALLDLMQFLDLHIDFILGQLEIKEHEEPFSVWAKLLEFIQSNEAVSTSFYKYVIEKNKQQATTKEDLLKNIEVVQNTPEKLARAVAPLDKVNQYFPLLTFQEEVDGQLSFGAIESINMASQKDRQNGKEINALISMDFSQLPKGLKVGKKIEAFDLRVMKALAQLGVGKHSVQKIFEAMGGRGNVTSVRHKIIESCAKMFTASLTLDNMELIQAGYKYQSFNYVGSFISGYVFWTDESEVENPSKEKANKKKYSIKGGITTDVIELYAIPPLVVWSNQLGQCVSVPIECWQCLRLTDNQIALVDYLITQIELIKRGTRNNNKISYLTVFESLNISGVNPKKRTIEKIKEVLDYYKKPFHANEPAYILGWEESTDKTGVVIQVKTKKEAISQNNDKKEDI